MTIDRAAIARLIALAGGDSGKLRADTERVLVFVGQGTVTAAHVEQVAERVEKSTDPWGLTNAIEAGDARTALRELRLRLDAGDNVFAMLGQIAVGDPEAERTDAGAPAAARPSTPCCAPTWRSSRRAGTRACCSSGWSWSCAAEGSGQGCEPCSTWLYADALARRRPLMMRDL